MGEKIDRELQADQKKNRLAAAEAKRKAEAEAADKRAAAELAKKQMAEFIRQNKINEFMKQLKPAVDQSTKLASLAMQNYQQAVAERKEVFNKYDAERLAAKQWQGSAEQRQAMGMQLDMAQGKGVSSAQQMLQVEQAKAQRQQLAMATARGGANISAIRGAGMAAAAQQGDIAGQAAALRAQEQQAAMQAYAAQANEIQRQRMGMESTYLQAALQGYDMGNQNVVRQGSFAAGANAQDFAQRQQLAMVPLADMYTKEGYAQQMALAKMNAESAMALQKQAQSYQDANWMKNFLGGLAQGAVGGAASAILGGGK